MRKRNPQKNRNCKEIRTVMTNPKLSITSRIRFIKCYLWSTLLYGVENGPTIAAAPKNLQNMDNEANAKNKLDKTCQERRGVTICRNEQVIARHRLNERAIVFRAHHEARISTR